MDKVPESAAVDQSVRLVKNSPQSKASGFVNALLRSVARAGENVLDYSKLKSDEKLSVKDSSILTILEVCNEMYSRGFEFTKFRR